VKTVHIKAITCPGCAFTYEMAGAATGQKGQPKPGHFGCCMKCGQVLIFTEALSVAIPTTDQLTGLAQRNPFLFDQITAMSAKVKKQNQLEQN